MWRGRVAERFKCSKSFHISGPRSFVPAWLGIVVILLFGIAHPSASQQAAKKNVLLLASDPEQHNKFWDLYESSVRAHNPGQITFYEAYLEFPFQEEKSYLDSEAEALRLRYAGLKLDLVMVAGPSALDFTIHYRNKVFPGVPIVFTAVSTRQYDGKSWSGMTGVTVPVGVRQTIDLALRLQPDTRTVAVLSPDDPYWLAVTHSALLRYRDKVREIDFIEPPSRALFRKVTALPPHTVVLFDLSTPDSGQPPLQGRDLIDAVAARMPTYSAWSSLCFNHGCIGGAYEDPTKEMLRTADVSARILSGEKPDNIPVVRDSDVQVRVDWRALHRWHIAESALPPGSVVQFREPTLWEQGRKYFITGAAVIILQALLISGLLWQRARRRKTETELRRSEEKFSKSFRRSPLAVTIVHASDGRYVDVNETFEERTGWRREEVIGRTPLEIGLWSDPTQRSQFLKQVLAEGNVRNIEVRYRRRDGEIRTSLGSAELVDVGGESCILSVVADITERKAAEEALASLSGRLIEAQDAERARIARELHDDINQRLAIVAVTLEMLKQHLPTSETKASGYVEEVCSRIFELGDDIQALSHRLHSSRLEYLGLEGAARALCEELSERQNVEIDFRSDGIPETLSDEISHCLFRVLQEAVHNAVKHSGVGKFEVRLTGAANEIKLRVHDSGTGFDAVANNGHGLGLNSMRERLKLVNGQLSIDSKPRHGTTILACVPLNSEESDAGEPDKSLLTG